MAQKEPITTPEPKKTRECPDAECDAIIGLTEEKCPKCGCEIADYDKQIEALEKATKAVEKKRKAIAPPTPIPVVQKKVGLLDGLTSVFTRKK